jgi:hypothetical protein
MNEEGADADDEHERRPTPAEGAMHQRSLLARELNKTQAKGSHGGERMNLNLNIGSKKGGERHGSTPG